MAVSNADLFALVRSLPVPVPWDRDVFIDDLARQRGRPIRLISTGTSAFTDGPCGLWLICDEEDVIVHEAATSNYHMDQIVCHEVGHMILGHRSGCGNTGTARYTQLCGTVLAGFDPGVVQAVLGRTDYACDQERDAERFASVLMLTTVDADERSPMMHSVFTRGDNVSPGQHTRGR